MTDPILSISMERPIQSALSLEQCVQLLQAIPENIESRTFLINSLILQMIDKIYSSSNNLSKEKLTKERDQIVPLMPSHSQDQYIWFPRKWKQKPSPKKGLYYPLERKSQKQKQVTITIDDQTKFICKVSSNGNNIHFYHVKTSDQYNLVKLASAVCECANQYSKADIIIDSQQVTQYQDLALYLYAYQHIQRGLGEEERSFTIELENHTPLRYATEEIQETVQKILDKDPALGMLYQNQANLRTNYNSL